MVEAYSKYLPDHGFEMVGTRSTDHDIKAVHAGTSPDGDVAHTHGLYWTADYLSDPWEWRANRYVIQNIQNAQLITTPSEWVAETFRRDMRVYPTVIPHGIDWKMWQDIEPMDPTYSLWNKNRTGDVCDPMPVTNLALAFPEHQFVSTLGSPAAPSNIGLIGVVPHLQMRRWIAGAAVYLATTKETFGIGILEAMACGVPVLGYAHGGILETVEHGVNGYLAQPGNVEDLIQGYDYCMTHRKALGENGREMAKQWTWQKAVEKVANVYRRAYELKTEPATVAVIIPTYNYPEMIARAIQSALDQDYKQLTDVVVVDDGSTDDGKTFEIVDAFKDPRIKYIRQDNQGVAIARNTGIASVDTKYVCPLDADDMIDPRFLSACIQKLEENRGLGIAFTGLRWIKPDGSSDVSQWPGPPNFDSQLVRQNQIPTCSVYRREMWARLGGYRQRYAPDGAGSEDAEFWTRAGAYGWGATKATTAAFFIYSWMSGRVSGKKDYNEPDWLAWHPWVKDELHPFASVATAKRFSHPVRQYDTPLVSVIVPVGEGHEKLLLDALDSLEAQTFRDWEAIVVWDANSDIPADLLKAYPYVKWIHIGGPNGAGEARNEGAHFARSPFLIFLDADDWLYPEAMDLMLEAWNESEAIIYTDYVGKAMVDDPEKLAADLQERIYQYKNGEAVIGYRAADYDWELAQKQPQGERPYLWANVTCLIPKLWHDEIGGFDEEMSSWEDVDYHYRMARAGKCYTRIDEELLVYRFSTGMRRDAGLQTYQSLVEYLKRKYEGIETVGCNCGGARVLHPNMQARVSSPLAAGNGQPKQLSGGGTMAEDSNMVMARYLHPNRGQHAVVGPVTKIKYGFRAGGDVFLVHKDDVRTQTHLYEEITTRAEPAVAKAPPAPVATTPVAPPAPAAPEVIEAPPDVVMGSEQTEPEPAKDTSVDIVGRLPGISAPIAEQLDADGIQTADQVTALGVEGLMKYKGIGRVKAEAIIEAIQILQTSAA